MKRIWVVLLIAGLLAWAAPAGAAPAGEDVRWEILSPAEKQTVSGMVDVTVDLFGNESVLEKKVMVQKLTIESPTDRQSMASPVLVRFGAGEPFWQAEVEVARGFDATTGFRRVTRLQRPSDMAGVTSMSFDWKVAGLSGGPYTMRVRLHDPQTEAVVAEGTRNIVLNAPDYSPVLNLDVPTVLNGATRIVASIVDEDAHHWKLDIVDGEGRERTLTVGKNESMAGVLTSWIPERSEATQRKTIPLPDAYDLTGLPDGAYTVRLYAVDAFGNESVLERKTVVEPRAPEPGVVSVAAYSGVGLNLRWEGATDNSGIAGYRVFLQAAGERRLLADLGPEARQYAQPLPPGQYGVVWQVVDRTGQVTELDPMGFEVRTGAVSIWQRGRFLSSDVPAFVEEGRTWVPLRLFGEAMGYEVFWDQDRQVATLRNNQIGRMLMMAVGEDTLQVQEGPVQVKVAIGAAPRLVSGRVMVPLRALVEALGAKVNWVQATQTVEIE